MSGGKVKETEFERLLRSIDANNTSTKECLETLTKSVVEIKEYIIHNDYRHTSTESDVKSNRLRHEKEIRAIKVDIGTILGIMESRSSMWRAFKKGKWIVSIIAMGILTAAGAGMYNYIIKPLPVINHHKEKPKVNVNPETKDLIE